MDTRGDDRLEAPRVAVDDWPIVLVDLPERRMQDATVHRLFDELEAALREGKSRGERSFVITDLTRLRAVSFPASKDAQTMSESGRDVALYRKVAIAS